MTVESVEGTKERESEFKWPKKKDEEYLNGRRSAEGGGGGG